MTVQIATSILGCDFANLATELETISSSDLIHVDVMDGHFVANLTIGPAVVGRISQSTAVPLDVHLMIERPELTISEYLRASHSVTFHYESTDKPLEIIREIRDAGCKVGMAIKPSTSVDQVRDLLPFLDMLLVMTVEPGFGGQSLIQSCVEKVRQAKKFSSESNPGLRIQVDGGVTEQNIRELALAGADTFVAGTTILNSRNRNEMIDRLRAIASAK